MTEDLQRHVANALSRRDQYNSALVQLFRWHVAQKFPGSAHWNPSKINSSQTDIGVDIDIPGASRAWHDIDIYPKNGAYLAIPLLPEAEGLSPSAFSGLFRPWRKGGGEKMNVLALNNGSSLVFMYALSKHVHQRQDPGLLPSDDAIVKVFFETFCQQMAAETNGALS